MQRFFKPNPLLWKEFLLTFCISYGSFEKLVQDIMGTSIPFFSDIFGQNRKSAASLEACLLMQIKTLAYRVPTHTFLDYFHISEELGKRACRKFDVPIKQCSICEFLHLPTMADIKSIVKLHKSKCNFDRIFGSLDFTYTCWKNCPKA